MKALFGHYKPNCQMVNKFKTGKRLEVRNTPSIICFLHKQFYVFYTKELEMSMNLLQTARTHNLCT